MALSNALHTHNGREPETSVLHISYKKWTHQEEFL